MNLYVRSLRLLAAGLAWSAAKLYLVALRAEEAAQGRAQENVTP